MKSLIITSDDKTGRRMVRALEREDIEGLVVMFDRSTDYRRVIRLVRRGSLDLSTLSLMAVSELMRKDTELADSYEAIFSNKDLMEAIRSHSPDKVYLFRAGLIVSRQALDCGTPIFNVHCATVPEYGGLGSIRRALKDGAYHQKATLHHVVTDIDGGEVIAEKPYALDKNLSYGQNEDTAYAAGIELLVETLKKT